MFRLFLYNINNLRNAFDWGYSRPINLIDLIGTTRHRSGFWPKIQYANRTLEARNDSCKGVSVVRITLQLFFARLILETIAHWILLEESKIDLNLPKLSISISISRLLDYCKDKVTKKCLEMSRNSSSFFMKW